MLLPLLTRGFLQPPLPQTPLPQRKKGYSSLQPGCSGFNRAILLTVGLFCSQSGYFALIGLLRLLAAAPGNAAGGPMQHLERQVDRRRRRREQKNTNFW